MRSTDGSSSSRGAVALLASVLAGCAPSEAETTDDATVDVAAGQLPSTHIHGIGVDPADGTILLATHDGLFVVDENGASNRVGPVIDLLGFAVAGAGHFVASGHPGLGTDMPQPVGLIESTDGGQTWDEVSRQGETDFHALTVSEAGVLGYDGSLLRSSDGQEWEQVLIRRRRQLSLHPLTGSWFSPPPSRGSCGRQTGEGRGRPSTVHCSSRSSTGSQTGRRSWAPIRPA